MSNDLLKEALIITLDGSGDFTAGSIFIYKNNQMEPISEIQNYQSIGYVYSYITKYLGMKVLEHEYKVMGLAPYGKKEIVEKIYNKVFKNLIYFKDNKSLELKFQLPTPRSYFYFEEKLLYERFDNIAGAVQLWI